MTTHRKYEAAEVRLFGELMTGAGCVGGQKKEWMECFMDDLRAIDINADQWTTAGQDEGEWCKTAEQEAECFMAKWIAAKKVRPGLRYAVVCPNMTGRTKETIAQSKRARAGSLTIVHWPQVARSFILRVFMLMSFSVVTFVLFLFRFLYFCIFVFFFTFIKGRSPSFNRSSICMRCTQLPNNCLCPLQFFFFFFCFFGDVAFPDYSVSALVARVVK